MSIFFIWVLFAESKLEFLETILPEYIVYMNYHYIYNTRQFIITPQLDKLFSSFLEYPPTGHSWNSPTEQLTQHI